MTFARVRSSKVLKRSSGGRSSWVLWRLSTAARNSFLAFSSSAGVAWCVLAFSHLRSCCGGRAMISYVGKGEKSTGALH